MIPEITLWMSEFIINYGFVALLISSFICATIFPASSVAILFVALSAGMEPISAVISSSTGNCLGCVFNYYLGRIIGNPLLPKLQQSKNGEKAIRYVKRYGTYSLYLAWTPFLGDPITIAAGIFKITFGKFVLIVFSFRIFFYIIVMLFYI